MTYSINLDATTNAKVKIKFYRNVTNVPQLRQEVMSGKLKCGLVKPNLIVSPLQIVVAANKALTAEKLKTRTIYTEILFNLSISKNITQSLQTFGIGDKDEDVLVIVIDQNNESNDDIFDRIEGEESHLDACKEIVNMSAVKSIYKINDVESKSVDVLDSVLTRIAAKDCLL